MSLNGIERLRPKPLDVSAQADAVRAIMREAEETRMTPPTLAESQRRLFYALPKRFQRKARWWFRR